jgi:hypothetical protein
VSKKIYAKVVLPGDAPDFEQLRVALQAKADPKVDVGLLQVGVHEAVLRPHLALHLQAKTGQPLEQLLKDSGASRVTMIDAEDVDTLYRQRVPEDLPPKAAKPVHPAWHLDSINVQPAWNALGGPDTIDWRGISVGQIDTGFTWHVAFGHTGPNTNGSWLRAADCRTILYPDIPAEYGVLPPPEIGNGFDTMPFGALNAGHGTRIGATISGWTDLRNGLKYCGVAPKVPHVIVRITDSVAINTRQQEFVEALDYLVNTAKVDAVNVSLGVFPPVASPAIRKAMQRARDKGVLVLCAAGNHVDPVVVPARLPTAIAVGATTSIDVPWSGSSFGPEVAFSAPGNEIHHVVVGKNGGLGTGFTGGGDGTSYATAMSTGSAALWLLRWTDEITQRYGRTAARVEAFKKAVQDTSRRPRCGSRSLSGPAFSTSVGFVRKKERPCPEVQACQVHLWMNMFAGTFYRIVTT